MVHNGLRGHVQRYKCKSCGRQFIGGNRRDKTQVITDYIEGKQTQRQLADKYGVSSRTIARDLEDMRYVRKISRHKQVVIQMDTTYWGRGFGLMAIKDALRNRILWRKYVNVFGKPNAEAMFCIDYAEARKGRMKSSHETVADYLEGVEWLETQGFKIYGIVCDGMRGLMQALRRYPVQMCQFHQMLIVRRYLTQDPDMEASQALLRLVNEMTKMDKESFMGAFGLWHERYKDVLHERSHDRRMKTPPYMRPRLRSAYLSIKRNMPWLWTFTIMTTGGYLTQTTESRACFRTSRLRFGCIAGLPENIERNLSMSIYQDTTDLHHHPFCLIGTLGTHFITQNVHPA